MAERIQPPLGNLSRLQARMDVEGFLIDDELLVLVREAQDAVERLFVKLHYLTCDGVGRRRCTGRPGRSSRSTRPGTWRIAGCRVR